MIKDNYPFRIEKQTDVFEKSINAEDKAEIAETLIWLYQSYVKDLLQEIDSYKSCYGDDASKRKIKQDLKREITRVIDNY